MKCRVTLDEAGRICIPDSVLSELGLRPGAALELERHEDTIVLRPVPDSPSLTKEHGVWVLNNGQPLPASATDDVLQQVREEHDLTNHGKGE